jgi:hypothetical protein
MPVKGEHEQLKKLLVAMTAQYEQAVKLVADKNDAEITDFHARRLVEMAGHIVMGYLLLLDAQRCSDFEQSAAIFITRGQAWNNGHFSFIEHFEPDHIAAYSALKIMN